MTQLQRLYETADGLGLQICYFPMEKLTAISTPDGFIGMDVDKLEDSARETACLAHEMGHCLTGSFYTVDSGLCQQRRCEERADRWAIRQLVPLEDLKRALEMGLRPWSWPNCSACRRISCAGACTIIKRCRERCSSLHNSM